MPLSRGKVMMNSVNAPGSVSTSIRPLCCLTMISCVIDRPSPVPSPVGLVVKKGLNIFALTSGEMPMPYRLHLPCLCRATSANHLDAMRNDLNESIVVPPETGKQFDFILCHKLKPIDVIAELVQLAKRSRQRRLVRGEQGGGNAVELTYRITLDLPIGFDLALQCDEVFGTPTDSPENLETDRTHHDEQHRNC